MTLVANALGGAARRSVDSRRRPEVTKVLGIKCTKDSLDWALVEGHIRSSAAVVDSHRVTAPARGRGQQLMWIRKEDQEVLQRYTVDEVVVRVAEPGGRGNALPRAEAEGVVQEAVAAAEVICRRVVAVSLRAAFSVKNGADLTEALNAVPAVVETPKTRRDPVTAALVAING